LGDLEQEGGRGPEVKGASEDKLITLERGCNDMRELDAIHERHRVRAGYRTERVTAAQE